MLQYIDLSLIELSSPVCTALAGAISVSCSIKELKLSTSQTCTEGLKLLTETVREGFKLVKDG